MVLIFLCLLHTWFHHITCHFQNPFFISLLPALSVVAEHCSLEHVSITMIDEAASSNSLGQSSPETLEHERKMTQRLKVRLVYEKWCKLDFVPGTVSLVLVRSAKTEEKHPVH